MVANSVLNRILYEMELNEKMSEVVKVVPQDFTDEQKA